MAATRCRTTPPSQSPLRGFRGTRHPVFWHEVHFAHFAAAREAPPPGAPHGRDGDERDGVERRAPLGEWCRTREAPPAKVRRKKVPDAGNTAAGSGAPCGKVSDAGDPPRERSRSRERRRAPRAPPPEERASRGRPAPSAYPSSQSVRRSASCPLAACLPPFPYVSRLTRIRSAISSTMPGRCDSAVAGTGRGSPTRPSRR